MELLIPLVAPVVGILAAGWLVQLFKDMAR